MMNIAALEELSGPLETSGRCMQELLRVRRVTLPLRRERARVLSDIVSDSVPFRLFEHGTFTRSCLVAAALHRSEISSR